MATERLRWLKGVPEQDLDTAMQSLIAENEVCSRKKQKLRSEDIYIFLQLCDRLQVDDDPTIKYSFISKLRRVISESATTSVQAEFAGY